MSSLKIMFSATTAEMVLYYIVIQSRALFVILERKLITVSMVVNGTYIVYYLCRYGAESNVVYLLKKKPTLIF